MAIKEDFRQYMYVYMSVNRIEKWMIVNTSKRTLSERKTENKESL